MQGRFIDRIISWIFVLIIAVAFVSCAMIPTP